MTRVNHFFYHCKRYSDRSKWKFILVKSLLFWTRILTGVERFVDERQGDSFWLIVLSRLALPFRKSPSAIGLTPSTWFIIRVITITILIIIITSIFTLSMQGYQLFFLYFLASAERSKKFVLCNRELFWMIGWKLS